MSLLSIIWQSDGPCTYSLSILMSYCLSFVYETEAETLRHCPEGWASPRTAQLFGGWSWDVANIPYVGYHDAVNPQSKKQWYKKGILYSYEKHEQQFCRAHYQHFPWKYLLLVTHIGNFFQPVWWNSLPLPLPRRSNGSLHTPLLWSVKTLMIMASGISIAQKQREHATTLVSRLFASNKTRRGCTTTPKPTTARTARSQVAMQERAFAMPCPSAKSSMIPRISRNPHAMNGPWQK